MQWLLENPATSCITNHPWLIWAIQTIKKAGGKDALLDLTVFYRYVSLFANGTPEKIINFHPAVLGNKHFELRVVQLPCCTQHHAEVFKTTFWMRHYKSPTDKRTMVLSNNFVYGLLDRGILTRKKKKKSFHRTTKRYRGHDGKNRFSGTSQLKASQNLCSNLSFVVNFDRPRSPCLLDIRPQLLGFSKMAN